MSVCPRPSSPGPATSQPSAARRLRSSSRGERRRSDRRTSAAPHASLGILIVEDDDDSREILGTFLEAHGYPVMVARHGREALDRLQQFAAPCLIFLDLRMPIMDGWALRRALLADPFLATIPVVVLSAVHNVADAVTGLNVTDYLHKPYDFHAILRIVKRYC